MQAVAGNNPLRPFRPPMHGDSKSPELKLLWNGSSHARFCHSSDTHLKQSIPASKTIGYITHYRYEGLFCEARLFR